MKIKFLLGVVVAFFVVLTSCNNEESGEIEWKNVTLETRLDTTSYVLGADMAENYLQAQSIDINYYAFLQGIMDVIDEDKESIFDEEEKKRIFMMFQEDMRKKQEEKSKEDALKYKEEGRVWLEQNKLKEGVQETGSGLQYKIVEPGTDVKPKATDIVKVHYTGTLLDGTVFDSSVERGEPVSFPLNRVISGWTEGLQLVGVGGKIELYIPSDLAYGDQQAGPNIPGGSTLVFEVELLEILDEMPQQ